MKTIRWAGAALIASAATVAVFLVATSAGAYVYQQHLSAKKLTVAQKTGLANAIKCSVPGMPVAALKDWRCTLEHPESDGVKTDVWKCAGSGSLSITEEAYLDKLLVGAAGPYESRADGMVTVPVRTDPVAVEGACLAQMSTWIGTVWAGHTAASLQAWYAARNPRIAGQVDVEADALVTGTAAQALDAGVGKVDGPQVVGVVE